MKEALLSTIKIVGWLGIILGILVLINTICGVIFNTSEKGEMFSWKILLRGIVKALIFYGCCALLAIAFTMLPFINQMIANVYGVELLSSDILTTLSTVAVLGIVINAIVTQGKKALEGITKLLVVKANNEVITWKVVVPEEEKEEGEGA